MLSTVSYRCFPYWLSSGYSVTGTFFKIEMETKSLDSNYLEVERCKYKI